MDKYRKTVVGVIYQSGEFLLVKKSHWINRWDFPQGGVNEGESLESALNRELNEELGTNKFRYINNTRIIKSKVFFPDTLKKYEYKGFIGKELFYFVVPFTGDKNSISLSKELIDKKWCDKIDVFKSIHPKLISDVEEVFDFMKRYKLF